MAEINYENHPLFLQTILDTSISAVFVLNPQGEIVYASKQAERILGLTVSVIKQRRYNSPEWRIQKIDGSIFPDNELPFSRVMQTKKPVYDVELSVVWPNDERKYLLVGAAPILTSSGEIECCICMVQDITSPTIVKQQLAQNYDELQMILDAMPALVFYKDTQNNIIRVNRLAAAPKGVSPREMENTPTSKWYPDEAEKYFKDDLEVIQSGRPKLGIVEQYDVSSRKLWVKTDKFPYFDKSGKLVGILVFAIDITKEKETELRLRESEELFRSVFENSATGIIVTSPEGKILKANEAFCRYLGYRLEDFARVTIYDITHPDDIHATDQSFNNVRQGKERLVDIEKRYIRKNGDVVWARVSATWIADAQGHALYGVAMIQDITRRKMAEEQLIQSEDRFRSIFEKAAVGMALYTNDGKYVQVNDALCHMLGYSEYEMLNMTVYQVTYPDDLKQAQELHEEIFSKKLKNAEYERRIVHKNGMVFWVKGVLSWIFDDHGHPLYGVAMIQNIEAIKKSEQKIKDANVELERRVAQRTTELEEKNTALREVLGQLEIEKTQIQKKVVSNIEEVISPVVEKLKRKGKVVDQRYLDLLAKSLENIGDSFGQKIAVQKIKLSPKEIEICNMIRNGLATKEISDVLRLSMRTVENHRNNIRIKLGLANKKVNLTSYLNSI